jgi:hypothetical protein
MKEKIMYQSTKKCRICANTELDPIVDLGTQILTGVFPKSKDEKITAGPLELVKCREDKEGHNCGLVQLKHSYDLGEMYGDNYGYRSGLNKSMVDHLNKKVSMILSLVELKDGDLVIDIGSNDSTLLQAYPKDKAVISVSTQREPNIRNFIRPILSFFPIFFHQQLSKKTLEPRRPRLLPRSRCSMTWKLPWSL